MSSKPLSLDNLFLQILKEDGQIDFKLITRNSEIYMYVINIVTLIKKGINEGKLEIIMTGSEKKMLVDDINISAAMAELDMIDENNYEVDDRVIILYENVEEIFETNPNVGVGRRGQPEIKHKDIASITAKYWSSA